MGNQDTRRAARPKTLSPSRAAADEFRPAPSELPREDVGVTEEGRSLPARVLRAAREGLGRRTTTTLDDPDDVYDKARRDAGTRLGHARQSRSAAVAMADAGGRGGFGPKPARSGGSGERTRRMTRRKVRRIGLFRLVLIMAVAGALGSWLGMYLQDAFNDALPTTSIYGVEKQKDQKPSSSYTF